VAEDLQKSMELNNTIVQATIMIEQLQWFMAGFLATGADGEAEEMVVEINKQSVRKLAAEDAIASLNLNEDVGGLLAEIAAAPGPFERRLNCYEARVKGTFKHEPYHGSSLAGDAVHFFRFTHA